MKKLALAAALTVAASTAYAGQPGPAVMEPEVIVEDTSSSGGGVIVPLMIILIAWAALN